MVHLQALQLYNTMDGGKGFVMGITSACSLSFPLLSSLR